MCVPRAANVPVIAVDFGYSKVAPEALNAHRLKQLVRRTAAGNRARGDASAAVAAAAAPVAGGNPP